MKQKVLELLEARGVSVDAIARVVYENRRQQIPELTPEEARESVERVLEKREAQYAVLTGLILDILAEEGKLPEPLAGAIRRDDSLYGIDEILALAITNLYGSDGLTDFGYLDKTKIGIIGEVNQAKDGKVNTFLDDLIAGVAAAAGARLAHQRESGKRAAALGVPPSRRAASA